LIKIRNGHTKQDGTIIENATGSSMVSWSVSKKNE
jgi:hypothetical protein